MWYCSVPSVYIKEKKKSDFHRGKRDLALLLCHHDPLAHCNPPDLAWGGCGGHSDLLYQHMKPVSDGSNFVTWYVVLLDGTIKRPCVLKEQKCWKMLF